MFTVPGLSADERRAVETEEGWILGVGAPAPAKPRSPEAITARSFAMIDDVLDLTGVAGDLHGVAARLVHSSGDPAIVGLLRASEGAAARGVAALAAGATVLVDAEMVARGITRRLLPAGNTVMCTLGLGTVAGAAARDETTRSAAAVELWPPWLDGAVVAIGNAPTALMRLLDGLEAGWPRPALIVGFPVGFVGAAEAKDALAEAGEGLGVYITLTGRAGGSALAAAAVNALALEAGK
jgi:precorrin-8X/cobalt-precorrin-8 methylmutase